MNLKYHIHISVQVIAALSFEHPDPMFEKMRLEMNSCAA